MFRFRLPLLFMVMFVLAVLPAAATPALAASITPVTSDDAGAADLAQTMLADASTFVAARFVDVPATGTPHAVADSLSFFQPMVRPSVS